MDQRSPEARQNLRQAIEEKRARIERPGVTTKVIDKKAVRKEEWLNEIISIKCVDANGACPEAGCSWKIPRKRLTPDLLQELCMRCPLHIKVEHLRDDSTKDVVWLQDVQKECKKSPWEWVVVPVEEREVQDAALDPRYQGACIVVVRHVPLRTDNGLYEVLGDDVRAWLLFGVVEEDVEIKQLKHAVKDLRDKSRELERRMTRVGYTDLGVGAGGASSAARDAEEAEVREEFYRAISMEKERVDEERKAAEAALAMLEAQRGAADMVAERAAVDAASGTATYYISFGDSQQAEDSEAAIVGKRDWPGIKLAVAAAGEENSRNDAENSLEDGSEKDAESVPENGPGNGSESGTAERRWVGRGPVPDGSKSYLADHRQRVVNMRGAQVCRLQHGFGQSKQVPFRKRPKHQIPEYEFLELQAENPALAAALARDSEGNAVSVGGGTGGSSTGSAGQPLNVPFAGPYFELYHGQWREGLKHGLGMALTSAGAYYGGFAHHRRSGEGEVHYANGDHVQANYLSQTRFRESDPSANPYAIGVPNGPAVVTFADGSVYEGEMTDGRVTGKGAYWSTLGSRETGLFKDGVLHGGAGTAIDARGGIRSGSWQHGRLHGYGSSSAGAGADRKRRRRGGNWGNNGNAARLNDGNARHGASPIRAGGNGGPFSGGASGVGGNGGGRQHEDEENDESSTFARYEGDWIAGQRHGMGRERLQGGSIYEGFFSDHDRCGSGVMWHGRVATVTDTNTGRKALRSNRVYEGDWRGGEARPGTMVTLTALAVAHCVGYDRAGRFVRAIQRALKREEVDAMKVRDGGDIHQKYAALLRHAVEKRKRAVARRQVVRCIEALEGDCWEQLSLDALVRAYRERDVSLAQDMRLSGIEVETPVPLAVMAQRLDAAADDAGTTPNRTVIGSLVQSMFEQIEEQHSLVPLADIVKTAEKQAHELAARS